MAEKLSVFLRMLCGRVLNRYMHFMVGDYISAIFIRQSFNHTKNVWIIRGKPNDCPLDAGPGYVINLSVLSKGAFRKDFHPLFPLPETPLLLYLSRDCGSMKFGTIRIGS
jgi:hypothetical protein